MLITTIHFPNTCDEAISYYKEVLGAKVKEIAYAKDAPPNTGMEEMPPNFVMYSEVLIFDTIVSMTDGGNTPITSDNFSFMISFDSDEETTSIFNKIADGGKVVEPLGPQFWAPLYGFVKDRFGVGWQVMTKEKHCQSCGMPMCKDAVYGTNADGSKSEDYCEHCFENGKFTGGDCTMEEMIELCVPYVVEANPNMSKNDAKKMMQELFPTLKRWKSA